MDKKARRAALVAEMREMNEKVVAEKLDFEDTLYIEGNQNTLLSI